jgi:hypothetical protein
MNCNEFETKIIDLARGQAVEAGARDRAMAHAADCRGCAARWRDEQRLTAGLREWASTFSDEQMSARGAAQLMAAVRAERRRAPVTRRARHRGRWAAAAAVLIILIALVAMRFVEWRKPQPIAGNLPAPQTEPSPSPAVNPPPANTPSAPLKGQAFAPHRRAPREARKAPAKGSRHPADAASLATAQPGAASPATANDDAPASEIATAFIPLAGGRSFAPTDSLQLMRVELPRSALVSFGLPMNVERADQRIKADVLIGNDGVARAIRFVR